MARFTRLAFAFFFVVSLTTGCAEKHLFSENTNYYMALQQDTIADEILFLEKIIKEKGSETTGAPPETYYFLALLYSHNNNPAPDYDKAISALDRYEQLTVHPRHEQLEIQYLKNILQEAKQLAQLRDEHECLKGEKDSLLNKCASLRQQLDVLNKENETMKNHIDQLKMLDIRLEQKKRAIR